MSFRYDAKTIFAKKSANISKGRVLDPEFDTHLFRVVLYFRVKEVKVTNIHIKLLARKLLLLPKYKHSSAHKLKFSDQWMWRWKKRYHLVNRQSAKTHITKAKAEDIDAWQAEIQSMIQDNNVPLFLIGNKDETPTKLNVSSAHTVDVKGTNDVRFRDQGQLKSQYTSYCGGWAGAMISSSELLNSKPANVSINDFTKDGHILPCMSIFKGKTARALTNVLIEACCFDPIYSTYLSIRPDEVFYYVYALVKQCICAYVILICHQPALGNVSTEWAKWCASGVETIYTFSQCSRRNSRMAQKTATDQA